MEDLILKLSLGRFHDRPKGNQTLVAVGPIEEPIELDILNKAIEDMRSSLVEELVKMGILARK